MPVRCSIPGLGRKTAAQLLLFAQNLFILSPYCELLTAGTYVVSLPVLSVNTTDASYTIALGNRADFQYKQA